MSTLPPFFGVIGTSEINTLGIVVVYFLAKKGGQKALISRVRKIREPGGPADRRLIHSVWRDPDVWRGHSCSLAAPLFGS
jgi:hypothetical protein